MTILRGIPGSGKSTWARKFAKEMILANLEASVYSADDYFVRNDGSYHFDQKRLGDAHADCYRRFLNAFWKGFGYHYIIDNTNTRAWEMAPYVQAANAYKVECEVITFHCDPDKAWRRNVHGVPATTVLAMHNALMREELPPFWKHTVLFGWGDDAVVSVQV